MGDQAPEVTTPAASAGTTTTSFGGLRARLSARTWDLAIQNGTKTTKMANTDSKAVTSDGRPSKKQVFGMWPELRVRTRVRILDIIMNFALFTPLAVLFQVGATGVQDSLFVNYVPSWVATLLLLAIGIGIEFGCSFWQQTLSRLPVIRENDPDAPVFIATTRLYHFALGFANVCHYRGLSDIYYYILGYGAFGAVQAISTTVLLLSGLKCARNVLGPPLSLGVDSTIEEFFETSTLFRSKLEDRYMRQLADNAATVLVVTSLCFLHWIAVWTLFDNIIYPSNLAVSVVVSWILGYALCSLVLALEPRLKLVSRSLEKRNPNWKVVFEDAVLLISNAGVILVWRGHWVFFESMADYFPIYHYGIDMSQFYGMMSSFIMMCLLHTSATLIMKGCDFDGDLKEGEGLSFSLDYFADFFSEEIIETERLRDENRDDGQTKNLDSPVNNNETLVPSGDENENESKKTL